MGTIKPGSMSFHHIKSNDEVILVVIAGLVPATQVDLADIRFCFSGCPEQVRA